MSCIVLQCVVHCVVHCVLKLCFQNTAIIWNTSLNYKIYIFLKLF